MPYHSQYTPCFPSDIIDFSCFLTSHHDTRRALDNAKFCAQHHCDTLWIEGEAGTGKTLLSHIIASHYYRDLSGNAAIHHITIPLRNKGELFIPDAASSNLILFISIKPDISISAMLDFQEHLALTLNNHRLTVKFLCFMSEPLASYNADITQHFTMMQELFVEHKRAHIMLPPLNERIEDIALLAQYFLQHFAQLSHNTTMRLTSCALGRLRELHWPHNVTHLQQCCYLLSTYDVDECNASHIDKAYEQLMLPKQQKPMQIPLPRKHENFALERATMTVPLLNREGKLRPYDELEEEIFTLACHYRRGSKTSAARELKIGRTTLYRKMRSS